MNVTDLSLQEALDLVMTISQSRNKVIKFADHLRHGGHAADAAEDRQEQVVRECSDLSHADATEVNQIVRQVGRLETAGAAQIVSLPKKTANT